MLTHSAKKLTNQIPLPGPSLEWMPLPTVTRAIKLACAMCEAPQRFKEAALSTLPGSQLFQAPKGVLSLSAGTSMLSSSCQGSDAEPTGNMIVCPAASVYSRVYDATSIVVQDMTQCIPDSADTALQCLFFSSPSIYWSI